jgi:precorrin-4 methylase
MQQRTVADNYALDAHRFLITFFPDKFAAMCNTAELTLDELADLIVDTAGSDKATLPWLKLARFGDKLSDKGSLRTNANMLELTGIEAEHDAGAVTFDAAIAALVAAGVRCVVYTTPSYIPDAYHRAGGAGS